MVSKRFLKAAVILIALLSMVAAGCGPQPATPPKAEPKPEPKVDPATRTLTTAQSIDIDTLDPQQMGTAYDPHNMMFGYPVTLGLKNDQPYPFMAKSVQASADGLTITFTLPDDLKLSNGKKVTGQDWIKTIERYKKISPYASDFDEVKEMKADGQKVTLTFKGPNAYFWPVLASSYTGVIDWEEAEKVGKEAFGQKPIGAGPYKLKQWVRGSQVVLEKNPNFTDYIPFVKNHGGYSFDTIVIRIIPDNFTRISELEAGNVDYVYDVPAEFVDRIKANPKLKLISAVRAGEAYLRLNTTKAPFNNVKFRQALNYAINRDEIKAAWKGGVEPVYTLLSPAQLCYSAQTEAELKAQLKTDPAKAKALLAELGYKDTNNDGYLEKSGQRLTLTLQGIASHRVGLTVIQAQLKNVGIEVKVMEQPGGVVTQSVKDRKFDMTISTWWWTDPDIWFYGLHSKGSTGVSVWSSKETDQMLEDQRKQVDVKQRTATWSALSKKVAQELPLIPMYHFYDYKAIRSNIEGYQVGVDGAIFWNDAIKK